MGGGSISLFGATTPGAGEAGTLDATGVSRRAIDAPAVSDATGDPGPEAEGAGGGVALTAGVGVELDLGVGRAVGIGVDRTVGLGVAEALTTIVPNICSG
jgi:hypothetical protein